LNKNENGKSSKTQDIYENLFINTPKELEGIDIMNDFMNPNIIVKLANLTNQFRIDKEDSQDYLLKIFGDVLESLFGAIFIDTGCNLTKTREVFMNVFRPYLYVYGNIETMKEHPRTNVI
jgi:dsRNA-specific ribonuclease